MPGRSGSVLGASGLGRSPYGCSGTGLHRRRQHCFDRPDVAVHISTPSPTGAVSGRVKALCRRLSGSTGEIVAPPPRQVLAGQTLGLVETASDANFVIRAHTRITRYLPEV